MLDERVDMRHVIGYCKECGGEVSGENAIFGYPNIFECTKCKHPSVREKSCDEVPYYLMGVS